MNSVIWAALARFAIGEGGGGMKLAKIIQDGQAIALVESAEVLVRDGQSALDMMMTVQYETACSRMALNQAALSDEFFDPSSGLADVVLQKFGNYRMRLAVYGDYSSDKSDGLQDFFAKCRQSQWVNFVATRDEAISWLLHPC